MQEADRNVLEAVATGHIRSAARLITRIERDDPAMVPVLQALYRMGGRSKVIGVTGPPGAGKSTLISSLVGHWRRSGLKVAVLAVDPSSPFSGGAVLGDRLRMVDHSGDAGVFIRSMASRGHLGGLSRATGDALTVLDAMPWDIVLIETVGVGQSETDVSEVADTVCVVVQPGSGDVLQFLKSGIMEIPDVLVVTKSDLGQLALRARRDLSAALRSAGSRETKVIAVSSIAPPQGIDELATAISAHAAGLDLPARRASARRAGAIAEFEAENGRSGMRALGGRRAAEKLLDEAGPELDQPALVAILEASRR